MNNYTIYCTSEQTRKAFELGAPIEKDCSAHLHDPDRTTYIDDCSYCKYYCNPTAEEMIGWLEKQISFIDVIRQENDTWLYIVYPETHSNKNITVKGFSSRKEATLAAINAALDYLSNNK